MIRQPLNVVVAHTDGIFQRHVTPAAIDEVKKTDRSIPIVSETEQIGDCRNSPLKSRAQISDGSGGRFFVVRRKICT
jgi:hypothetical protein